jgi:hypothetical protein
LNCFFYFRRGQISSNLYRKKRWHFKKGHAKKRNKGNRRRSTALSLFFLFFFFFYYYLYCLIRVKIKILKIGPRSAKPRPRPKKDQAQFYSILKNAFVEFCFLEYSIVDSHLFRKKDTLSARSRPLVLSASLCVCVWYSYTRYTRHTAFFDRR